MEKNTSSRTSSASVGAPRPLFVYGTLRAKPLLAWAVLGDSSRVDDLDDMIRPAQVSKYTRVAVKHSDYPAVIRSVEEGDCVDGYLLQLDTRSQRKKLDDFEGETYAVESTIVSLLGSDGHPTGETVQGDIYVWVGDKDMLTTEPWELDKFIKERLEDWLDLFDGMEMVGEDYRDGE
ncbi:Major facilitator superfamily general substrate transporter [Cordyceps militaris]|uniref:Putative gamma-glutamylcyclotransferase n=1 Tax=Cordyceps militaris TaxID=73501 RepID=A0A2H4SD76_CORMI|nr:Major facilitator superfamily general substrate transporter [Cordyceps militaris]